MSPLSKQDLQDKYCQAYELLNETYGQPTRRVRQAAVDQLINTILSQNTSGINRERAFQNLKARFPDWAAVMDAPTADVRDAIESAGLANQKAPRIQAALRQIYQREGRFSLEFLAELPLEQAKAWLMNLHGVGPKTASIVLLFTFGREAFPVDTHVHRIARRLGLIGPRVGAEKAHAVLEQLGPPETYYPFHINLVRHGREVCRAQQPRCGLCALQHICDYYNDSTESEQQ